MAVKGMSEFRADGENYTINDPNIANEFSTSTAYAAGTYVNYQGDLYRFTADHAAGAWNSAHVSKVLLGADVSDLKSALDETRKILGEENKNNVLGYTIVNTSVNNVGVTSNGDSIFRINGTANSGGGRTTKLTKLKSVPAGTYYFEYYTDATTKPTFVLQDSSNTIVKEGHGSFTLASAKELFLGINVTNGTAYDLTIKIQVELGSAATDWEYPITAVDHDARKDLSEFKPLVSELTSNNLLGYIPISKRINNVLVTSDGDGEFRVYGTTTASGGRLIKLTNLKAVSAGTYCFTVINSSTTKPTCVIQDASNNVVKEGYGSFTLANDTSLFVGMNFENNTSFDLTIKLQLEAGSSGTDWVPAVTAVDYIARKTAQGVQTWLGKKWVCVGDSLTQRPSTRTDLHYYDYIAEKTGITVVPMGVSGTGYAKGSGTSDAFYQRILNVPTDADVITIFGSGNDASSGVQLGNPSDTGTSSLCGCINTTIDNLYSVYPLAVLGIVTPTPWTTYIPSDTSNWFYKYSAAIVQICFNRGIPCLDLYHDSALRPWDLSYREIAYSKDDGGGVHPDETGHKLIAPRFKAFLDSLIL